MYPKQAIENINKKEQPPTFKHLYAQWGSITKNIHSANTGICLKRMLEF